MNILKYALITNTIVYLFGLLWFGSTMDHLTLYSSLTIAFSGFLIAVFPIKNVIELSSYIVHVCFVLCGAAAAIVLLVEDFTRKYGYNTSVITIRILFLGVICYYAYTFWKYRKDNVKPE